MKFISRESQTDSLIPKQHSGLDCVNLQTFNYLKIVALSPFAHCLQMKPIRSEITENWKNAVTVSANLLADSTSPYLLQHRDNPVHWRQWNAESLEHAQNLNKPILLSIGYAACHWCHVMAHESFEDQKVADVMNEHFISIKVDREERPDIDHIYMSALHQLGEQGGWPLTMFLTPDGKPFWGGTYFPKEPKWGRPGFIQVLLEISRLFNEDRNRIVQNTDAIMSRLEMRPAGKVELIPEYLKTAAQKLYGLMDLVNGGTKGAPKFPQCSLLNFLWRFSFDFPDNSLTNVVLLTLERISQGGIYDHLGGGFARYSVDEFWLAPHFEKMLYDNAQLLDLLLQAYNLTGNKLFLERINETTCWLEREMLTEQGAFSASLDADTEGEEGKFYVWNRTEIEKLLENEAGAEFMTLYDVQSQGNWEGKTILNRLNSSDKAENYPAGKFSKEKSILLNERNNRTRPNRDDKILADWNGLAIAALARLSSSGISSESNRKLAETAFEFIISKMSRGDELGHSWRNGNLLFPGQLSDYAAMLHASLSLYLLDFDWKYIEYAEKLTDVVCEKFRDRDVGGFFMTASNAEDLIVRPKYCHDDAVPNANGLLCLEFVRLYQLTGKEIFKTLYEEILHVFSADALQNVFGASTLLSAFHFSLYPVTIALMGPKDKNRESILSIIRKHPNPNIIPIVTSGSESLPENHPAKHKLAINGKHTAYVCVGQTCLEPITEPDILKKKLTELR